MRIEREPDGSRNQHEPACGYDLTVDPQSRLEPLVLAGWLILGEGAEMARVNVEQKALTDPRFYRLGHDLGAPSEFAHAVGLVAMIRIWNECIERGDYAVDGWLLQAAMGRTDACELVCDAQLAVKTRGGKYRVKGTEGRIEYLEKLRESGRVNGPKGAQFGKLGGRPRKPGNRVSDNGADGIAGNPPPAPAPAPTKKDLSCASDAPSGAGVLVSVEPVPRFDFAAIYGRYPRKVGKTNGLKRLASSVKSAGDYAALVRALGVYLAHVAGKDKQYIRQFDTWTTTWRDWLEADAADTTTHAPLSDFDRRLLAAESKRMGVP